MDYERKTIEGFDGWYEVDNVGNVYSLKKTYNKPEDWDGKLSFRKQSSGYYQVKFYHDGKNTYHLIHRLVYEAFVGPIPKNMTIDHIDGDKYNNVPSNLQVMERSANTIKGWEGRRSKLQPVIRDWLARGYTRKFIAETLDVSHAYISRIATGNYQRDIDQSKELTRKKNNNVHLKGQHNP